MIKREYFVVIFDTEAHGIRSIEARCDSEANAKLFMEENAYLIKDLNKPYPFSWFEFRINEVVVMEGE